MDKKDRRVIGEYKNGNYMVYIFNDGSKIRYTEDDDFKPEFPENIDLLITQRCKMGCQFCYENCLPNGKTWDYSSGAVISSLLDSLHPYTELAINGNDLDDIPGFEKFLADMRKKHIFVNATFHFEQYLKHFQDIKEYQDNNALYGVGISINQVYDKNDFIMLNYCDNVVIHTVAGLFNEEIFNSLKNSNINSKKLLILGYKNIGRGKLYNYMYPKDVQENMKWLSENLNTIMDEFDVCSFDNLALEQLNVKDKVSEEIWNTHYMGDDGHFTMYIDAVNKKYAKNSCVPAEDRHDIDNGTSISNLFKTILQESSNIKEEIEQLDLD